MISQHFNHIYVKNVKNTFSFITYIVGENDYSKKCERVLVWLARFKHVDVVDSAVNLDKLRGIGFSYDELREMVGYPLLNTDFSQARALTKNYAEEGQNEKTEELI